MQKDIMRSPQAETHWRVTGYLLLVAAYVVSGKLALVLALPPGYASAIFPPAGIAVAAVLIAGRGALPWVFLGSLLLNIWTGYSASHRIDGLGVAAAVIIAAASMLQAAVGGAWLRRLIGYPTTLDNGPDLMRFLGSAPVICLVSASLSVGGLWAIGVVGTERIAISWGTWWIGDTLGVLVMLPLVLVAAGEPRALWRGRARSVALPMILAFALFVLFFVRVSKWEHEDSLMEFRLMSQHLVDQIQTRFEEQESLLEQMDGLFTASAQVTREEFHRFAEKPLARFPMVQALEWAPRVEQAQRDRFEAIQRKAVRGFEIREGPPGQLRRAAVRAQYYPVTYVEPLIGNGVAVGFDLASGTRREAAIRRSMESKAAVATPPVRLLQSGQKGVLLLRYVRGAGEEPGVVLVVLAMDEFIDRLLLSARPSLYVRLDDLDEGQSLYDNFPSGAVRPVYERRIEFGSRHYLLQTAPTPLYLAQHQGWQSWGALVTGLFGTGLLGALLLLGSGYTARVEAQVVERTARLAKSEAQFKEAQHLAHLGSWELDIEKNLLDWSDEIYHLFEVDPQAFGASFESFLGMVHPDERELVKRTYAESLKNRTPYEIEHRLLLPDGRIKYVREHCETFYDPSGRPVRSVGTVQDITARKQMERDLLESEERFRNTLESAPIGMAVVSLGGQFLQVNRALCDIVGYSKEELEKLSFQTITHPDDLPLDLANVKRLLAGEIKSYQMEKRYIRKDGQAVWIQFTGTVLRDARGEPLNFIGQVEDITERRRSQEQIRQLAYYDTLTGLANRRLMLDRLEHALDQARRFHRSLAIMFLDLDRFKQINDTLGHDVGDELLKAVAGRLSSCVRHGDTVSRQGGDEFVIVLAEVAHPDDAARVAEKVLDALSRPVAVGPHELHVTTSIGIAVYPVNGTDDMLELMKKADKAMYIAKEAGRNQYRFYPAETA